MRKHLILVVIVVLIGLFISSVPSASSSAFTADPEATVEGDQGIKDQVKIAILESIASNDRYIQKNLVSSLQVTDVQVSKDQQWATAWVVYYDPTLEAVIPTEPAVPITHWQDNQWQVYLPSDPGWQSTVSNVPDDLLSTDQKQMWVTMNQASVESVVTQSGYFLPWHGGQTAYLSRSVGHDMSFTSGTSHFAFDFFLPGNTQCTSGMEVSSISGLNFDIYAARAGTVWAWKDSVADCNHDDVNFIVIRNADDPTLFQLYMHLAQNSIPQALKSVGAPVARGQFIARADNTGNSTGSHLHFQIERQPYWPAPNPYWNTALDITFDDVDINGGRPRSSYYDPAYCRSEDVCSVFRSTYVSGNYYLGDSTPPTGGLSGVDNGEVVNTSTLTLSGWGTDTQSGFDYGQLIALFGGSWHNLGAPFKSSFTYAWDLCNSQLAVPNGPVSVAMQLYDVAGNPAPQVGLRHFTKTYSCPLPLPACVPGQNQVTLFEDSYFSGGCVKFNVGDYPTGSSLNPLGNNDAESILVGGGVVATLFSDENYSGHSQAFFNNAGLLKYQWISSNTTSSMKVSLRSTAPQAPILVSPAAASIFRLGDVIPLSWRNGGGASQFRVEIYLNSTLNRTIPWQAAPVLYADSLPLGSYTWRVQARNDAGVSAWSQQSTFSIESPIVVPSPETVPYSDTMELTQSKWVPSSTGFWSYKNDSTKAHSGTHSWWYQNTLGDYNDGHPNSGSLTSPPISITNTGYYLRFYYRNQTETQGSTWDQRWVQISVDGGPFINLAHIFDDPQIPETISWMRNKAIDLSAYAGHTVRIRFQFTTFDSVANNYPGWGIDDFSIAATPPSACGENRQDETPEQASLLTYNPAITIPGEICPNGDIDYYKFYGSAGDQIVADVNAMIDGSLLDSYLFLIDTDGKTILAENDDEVYGERRDALLSYILPANGFYYLKLKAWKNPLVGGTDYFYNIRLYTDNANPQVTLSWPQSGAYLPDTEMAITAQVSDVYNGVNRVEFYWHPTDWMSAAWEKLGTDWDGSDGWSVKFNPAGEPEGNTAAFFIQAYDMAGNWGGVAAWNIGIDKTPPSTAITSLSATGASNAFSLAWTAADNLSGIDYYDVQESMNAGNWTTLPRIKGSILNDWIIGIPGNSYAYRMRGVDRSGNTENYPAGAEVSTSIPNANILCSSLDTYDSSTNDNSPANASMIYLDGDGQFHNYCNPLIPGYQNDEDWVELIPVSGYRYLFISKADSAPSATEISLFAQDGVTLLAQSSAPDFGANTILGWTADRDQPVYVRLRHVDGRVIGTNVGGTFYVKTGTVTFLPVINR
jgi:murein DD-endopeptidase MepM/ murein hydrolase activator NlpD